MRRSLGILSVLMMVAALVLGGCGDDAIELYVDESGSRAPSPTSDQGGSDDVGDPGSTPSDGDAPEPVDHSVVALPYGAAVGGTVSTMLTRVDDPDEMDTFVSQFRREEFADEVRTAALAASYDGDLWAAVVSLGCDVPPDVFVSEGEAGYLVTPAKVADPLDNCFAPVTTVALVAIR